MASLVAQIRNGVSATGSLYTMSADTVVAVARGVVRRTFPWEEFFQQTWFIASVTLLPTILIAIPFGVIIALEVGQVARQIGAASFVGAVDALGIVREAAPLVTALLLAGAGGSAICSDLGARTIREEIDALVVLGISPLERLVAPRVLAAVCVATLLNGVVAFVGIVSGYLFDVFVLHGTSGSFFGSFGAFAHGADFVVSTVKAAVFGLLAAIIAAYKGLNTRRGPAGVGMAVNQSVVLTAMTLFVVNIVITQIYFALVPQQIV